MFLITEDMLFFHGDIELQRVRSDENSILWFSFRLFLKSHPYCSVDYPRRNHQQKHYILDLYLSVPELENRVFLDLVLLSFTPVATNSFSCPSTQWNSIGEETDVGRQRLNRALESLFTFTLLVFRTKQGAWHKRIQLRKGFHFPSTRTINSVRLILGSQYSLCEN